MVVDFYIALKLSKSKSDYVRISIYVDSDNDS